MIKTEYYCDKCKKETCFSNFIHIEIHASEGYNADHYKSGIRGGSESMNFCEPCAKSLGYEKNGGAVKWCKGMVKLFFNLKNK